MKFWNKSKTVREKHWSHIKLKRSVKEVLDFTNGFNGWVYRRDFDQLKYSLQKSSSTGKFYMCIVRKEVWFENPKDATWFVLKYSDLL